MNFLRFILISFLFAFFAGLTGCNTVPERFAVPVVDAGLTQDPDISGGLPAAAHMKTIEFHGDLTELDLQTGESYPLFLSVTLDDGKTYKGVTKSFQPQNDDLKGTVVWYSNNNEIAVVSQSGELHAVSDGSTTIIASLNGKSIYLTVHVNEIEPVVPDANETEETDEDEDDSVVPVDHDEDPVEDVDEEELPSEDEEEIVPDEPNHLRDAFLDNADHFTDDFGANSGFGYDDFPDVVLGPPGGSLDVVSFGTEGELLIELNDFLIVNGDGPDFTIFENPFPGWQECAEVEVSDDGVEFQDFNCQRIDAKAEYSGCAGVHSVVEGLDTDEYLNPNLSGGDVFDLDDLPSPLSIVRYVRIRHIGFCKTEEGEDTGPVGGTSGGFDFDAMAILNGLYD